MFKKIFVVDDNSVNLLTAEEALSNHFEVFTLSSAAVMFEALENIVPDLILLDIMMPDVDGFKALDILKCDRRYSGIPVIFLTSKNDPDTEVHGFEMGVVDFISKPFSAPVLLNRITTHLQIEGIIQLRTKKLLKLQNSLVSVLANMIESRDKLTGRHIERTAGYLRIFLEAMVERGLHAADIEEWDLETAVSSSRLHDVGKVAVPDMILNKPGKLEPAEFETMKTHAIEGEKIIDNLIAEAGEDIFLHNAKHFAGSHHEKWDGSGYPRGLSCENIPLQGRIMAIADVYDALVSERPYKKAFTHDMAVEIIRDSGGKHFDPTLVELFLEIHTKFAEVLQ
jgi:putative two-component system response regulator